MIEENITKRKRYFVWKIIDIYFVLFRGFRWYEIETREKQFEIRKDSNIGTIARSKWNENADKWETKFPTILIDSGVCIWHS